MFSAILSAFLVSPFVTIIDVAITLNTNGSMGLMQSMGMMLKELLFTPGTFLRRLEFMVVYGIFIIVYFTSLSTTSVFV